jgi:hypothetical protein
MFRRGIVAAVLALLATALAAPPDEPAAGGAPEPTSWAFAIGTGQLRGSAADAAERLGGVDLVVVDGEEATPADLDAPHPGGSTVLAYLSVGTIETCAQPLRTSAAALHLL